MPLIEQPLPSLLTTLHGPNPPDRPILIFYASRDENGRMWCGDCRRIEQLVKEKFEAEGAPTGIVFDVGDKPTWKSPENEYRKLYGIDSIPTIIKLVDGKESSRLVDQDITETNLARLLEG